MQPKLLAVTSILVTVISAEIIAENTIDYTVARSDSTVSESAEPSLAELAAKLNNPVSDVWMLFTQNDYYAYEDKADHDYRINSFKFQPVMSFPVTENYNFILRPVFQYLSMETPYEKRDEGLGDTAVLAVFGPSELQNNWIWGMGISTLLPTAAEKWMTTGGKDQTGIGPAVTAFYLGEKWVYGAVIQHWQGMGSATKIVENGQKKNQDDLKLTDLQYVLRYRVTPVTQVGFGPNIQIDWNEKGSDRFTIPIGFGGDTMIKLGPVPVRLGAELHYYVQQNDKFGPQWNLRLFAIPVMPNPFK